jgi:hypothetical protein
MYVYMLLNIYIYIHIYTRCIWYIHNNKIKGGGVHAKARAHRLLGFELIVSVNEGTVMHTAY